EAAIPPIVIALLGFNVLAAMLLPGDRPRPIRPGGGPPLRTLLRGPGIILFLVACVLSQAAHGPYYVFYSIHLEKAGYGPQAIGLLWALAVVSEVIAMLRVGPLLARAGPLPTMAACLLLSSVRWWICATSMTPAAMAVAQALHAASYAAFHVAAVTHTHRIFGPERRASGQAIYASATYGVGNVLGMFLSGLFYDRVPTAHLYAAAAWAAFLGALLVAAAARRGKQAPQGL
ncbi:MAG TPA: MFS transporter, partial [Candidatus Polarisedimenticolia bacterium]|nr:MFS transporter [Candidatus Polarisedimenticolia bacterium]